MIPKKFTLGAVEWKVVEVEKLNTPTQLGESSLGETKISISKTWSNNKASEGSKESTFYHEATHAMLDSLGYHELSNDEVLVQGLSTLIHQLEKTKE